MHVTDAKCLFRGSLPWRVVTSLEESAVAPVGGAGVEHAKGHLGHERLVVGALKAQPQVSQAARHSGRPHVAAFPAQLQQQRCKCQPLSFRQLLALPVVYQAYARACEHTTTDNA